MAFQQMQRISRTAPQRDHTPAPSVPARDVGTSKATDTRSISSRLKQQSWLAALIRTSAFEQCRCHSPHMSSRRRCSQVGRWSLRNPSQASPVFPMTTRRLRLTNPMWVLLFPSCSDDLSKGAKVNAPCCASNCFQERDTFCNVNFAERRNWAGDPKITCG
jgi:hypothetical protein